MTKETEAPKPEPIDTSIHPALAQSTIDQSLAQLISELNRREALVQRLMQIVKAYQEKYENR